MTEARSVQSSSGIRSNLNARELSPRLTTLEERTLGFLSYRTTNGDVALHRVEQRLQERFPKVRTKFYRGEHPFAEGLLREVAEECDGVVLATAD